MNALIVSGIVLTLLLLSILLSKKNKLYADKFLVIYLFFSFLSQIYLYVEYTGLMTTGYWMLMAKGIFLLDAPLFFMYVRALTVQKPLQLVGYVLMLSPFIAYTVNFLFHYFFIFGKSNIFIDQGLLYINHEISIPWLIFALMFLLIEPFFMIWFYVLLKNYRKRLYQSVSSVDRINLKWLNLLFNVWFISSLILLPIVLMSMTGQLPASATQVFMEIFAVIFFFIAGYYGFRQTMVFSNLELLNSQDAESKPVRYERSGLSNEQAKQNHAQLLKLMQDKKPYLDGELNASELSRMLGISVNHLSQILSQEQKQNFFDFVNSYRVQEVSRKMKDARNNHLTLLALAFESGFSSKTSFNTVFKKFTGKTPSDFYKTTSSAKKV